MRYSLNGHIVADSDAPILRWWGIPAACPADIRGALAENPEGEEFVLEITPAAARSLRVLRCTACCAMRPVRVYIPAPRCRALPVLPRLS